MNKATMPWLLLSPACLCLTVPGAAAPPAAIAAAERASTLEPARSAYIDAVQVYPYREGLLYRLYTAPGQVSDIALEPGEAVISVAAGDTVRWTIGDTTSGTGERLRSHILVKPFAAGLTTNLVILTDRRVYRLQLISSAATAMAAIAWTYPEDALLAVRKVETVADSAPAPSAGIDVTALDFGYRISGDSPSWRPLRAFDDGRRTWIEFPETIAVDEAPPLFLLDAEGKPALVNYRVSGRHYIVDRLFEVAELRLGTGKQTIVRITRDDAKPRRRTP